MGLALAAAALSAVLLAQDTVGNVALNQHPPMLGRELPKKLLEKPSQPPTFTVSVAPLGFSAPGAFYLGQGSSLASLDFLDENRLLFTFRVPGLLRRKAGEEDKRQIRAVVLALPSGTVEAEALWTVHDRARYLWMLNGGHFLLRDRDNLQRGDATLELKPYLRFPGPLLYLEMDPSQQFLAADSREPVAKAKESAEASDEPEAAAQPETVVRILRRDSGKVLLVSRTSAAVHLPMNNEGFLEVLRARGDQWRLNLQYFSGGSGLLGQVESSCLPTIDFVSQRELLAATCAALGGRDLVAMGTDGRLLWEYQAFNSTVRPLLTRSPDGSRLAWEALVLDPTISSNTPNLDPEDVRGQLIEILNAADGKVALDAVASPVLDAGGNVAISPSGRRVAVLNGGGIQVFELPPASLPEPAAPPPPR
jgi:hypothetical protein